MKILISTKTTDTVRFIFRIYHVKLNAFVNVENMTVARDYYYLTYRGIQKDVINYGPIEASFDVYDDFPSYKSGKIL